VNTGTASSSHPRRTCMSAPLFCVLLFCVRKGVMIDNPPPQDNCFWSNSNWEGTREWIYKTRRSRRRSSRRRRIRRSRRKF